MILVRRVELREAPGIASLHGTPQNHGELGGVLRSRASEHRRTLGRMPRERDEPVRLTRIYTRGGDKGQTSLGDGARVSKLDLRIGAYGTVDELNAALGVVLAGDCPDEIREMLARVQNELFDLGADLSVPLGGRRYGSV